MLSAPSVAFHECGSGVHLSILKVLIKPTLKEIFNSKIR